jgi:hypothetical protein
MERVGKGIETLVTSPVRLALEMIRIFPDGLIMGMGFFSVLTHSFSYGIFFASLLETLVIFHGLRAANTYLGISSILESKPALTKNCISGFVSRDIESLTLFGSGSHSAFPSAPIFMVSTASAYVFASLYKFSKEFEILGESYSSRFYIAAISLPLFILSFILFRLFFGCDTLSVVIFTAVIGLVLGVLLVEQNHRLFGLDSLNIIGIPFLRKRTADGTKLYVCPTKTR